jgi:hypothetical protein
MYYLDLLARSWSWTHGSLCDFPHSLWNWTLLLITCLAYLGHDHLCCSLQIFLISDGCITILSIHESFLPLSSSMHFPPCLRSFTMSRKELPYYHPCSLESLSSSLTLPRSTPWRATTAARDPPLQYLCTSVLKINVQRQKWDLLCIFFSLIWKFTFFSLFQSISPHMDSSV